jgi:hypothetical protein
METALANVHDPRDRPLTEIKWIALAISESGSNQRHIGLLYRDDDASNRITMLHLAWHHAVRSEAPQTECLWVGPAVEPELAPALQQLCRVVARKYGWKRRSIAYALRYEDSAFDPGNGEFLSKTGYGLTCATFVLAMFASYGVPLIRGEQWLTSRDAARAEEDQGWQRHIVESLRKSLDRMEGRGGGGAREIEEMKAHIAAVDAEIPCARFRPEEVAAAGTVTKLPASFAHAEPVGRGIVNRLRQRFPPTAAE